MIRLKNILKKQMTLLKKPSDDDPDVVRHPDLAKHMYQRRIGNEWHTKIMVGTPGKNIK